MRSASTALRAASWSALSASAASRSASCRSSFATCVSRTWTAAWAFATSTVAVTTWPWTWLRSAFVWPSEAFVAASVTASDCWLLTTAATWAFCRAIWASRAFCRAIASDRSSAATWWTGVVTKAPPRRVVRARKKTSPRPGRRRRVRDQPRWSGVRRRIEWRHHRANDLRLGFRPVRFARRVRPPLHVGHHVGTTTGNAGMIPQPVSPGRSASRAYRPRETVTAQIAPMIRNGPYGT